MNLPAYDRLSPAQRSYLQKQILVLESWNQDWKEKHIVGELARQEKAGIQVIRFDEAATRAYLQKAKDSGWEGAIKSSPEYGPRMRQLLSR